MNKALLKHECRQLKKTTLIWSLAVGLLGLLTIAVFSSLQGDMEHFRAKKSPLSRCDRVGSGIVMRVLRQGSHRPLQQQMHSVFADEQEHRQLRAYGVLCRSGC